MRNSKHWRERTLETERKKLERLIRDDVMNKLFNDRSIDEELFTMARLMKRMGIIPRVPPTVVRQIGRLDRKIRRMKKGTYRQRNGDR